MSRFPLTISYYTLFVAPFILFALANAYIYIFTSTPINPKWFESLMIGTVIGSFGFLLAVYEACK